MKGGFPKNRYKLHSAVEQKPAEVRLKNKLTNYRRKTYNKIAHWRARKGYGYKMKCVKHKTTGEVRRVSNTVAVRLSDSGKWWYCPKHVYKNFIKKKKKGK